MALAGYMPHNWPPGQPQLVLATTCGSLLLAVVVAVVLVVVVVVLVVVAVDVLVVVVVVVVVVEVVVTLVGPRPPLQMTPWSISCEQRLRTI